MGSSPCTAGQAQTEELPDTGALISACGTALDRHPRTADALVVGMAGPVADPLKARLTNAPLEVDLTDAGERYGIRSCRIINDFTAGSLRVPDRSRFERPLRGSALPAPVPTGPSASSAQVRGWARASLIRDSHGSWLPLPAEGGHVIFPFIGKEEAAFQDFAAREFGLGLLERRSCAVRARASPAPSVSHRRTPGGSRNRRRSARERNWDAALVCPFLRPGLPELGVVHALHGRSVHYRRHSPPQPLVTECAAFREAFYEGSHRGLLERIPVRRFTDMNSGLWGSAWFGMRMTA